MAEQEISKIYEVKELDYVIVLDDPEAPLERSKPRRRMMVVIAGFLGIGLSVIFAIIKEYISYNDDKNNLGEVKTLLLQNIRKIIPFKSMWLGKI